MKNEQDETARDIAELIEQLGRTTHDYADGLSPAQWSVLRYMSRANQFSRTVSAFAEFHATTRGTASQTVKSLVAQGLLSRTRSKRDGRSVIFDLTDTGRAVLLRDPCSALVNAAVDLPETARRHLESGLEQLLELLGRKSDVRQFGACGDCAHISKRVSAQKKRTFECELSSESLDETELTKTCVNFCSGQSTS